MSGSPSPAPEAFLQRISQLEHALQGAMNTIGNLEATIQSAQSSSRSGNPHAATIHTDAPISPTIYASSSVVRARPPDPFDGTDITLAPGFIQALEQYLNLVTFTTASAKLELAITYFRLPAQRWVLGAYRNQRIISFEDLAAQFRTVYSIDVDTELEISLDQLTSLRQSDSQSVSEHYANFLALSFAAGSAHDASHAQLFFQSLKFPLRRSMLRDGLLKRSDIKSVLAAAIRHERAFLASKNLSEAPPTPRRAPVAVAHAAPVGPAILQRLGPRPNDSARGPAPMDLDAAQVGNVAPRRARLTPDERQRRIDQNLCIVCGDPNHFRDACPHASFRRPRQAALNAMDAAVQQPAPALAVPEPQAKLAYIDMTNWDSDDINEDLDFDI